MDSIAERIRTRRRELDMTQQQLAAASGIERYNIGKIETGARDVSATEMVFLAEALDTDPSMLVPRVDPVSMFRMDGSLTESALATIAWFERYTAESARLRALDEEVHGARG